MILLALLLQVAPCPNPDALPDRAAEARCAGVALARAGKMRDAAELFQERVRKEPLPGGTVPRLGDVPAQLQEESVDLQVTHRADALDHLVPLGLSEARGKEPDQPLIRFR